MPVFPCHTAHTGCCKLLAILPADFYLTKNLIFIVTVPKEQSASQHFFFASLKAGTVNMFFYLIIQQKDSAGNC